MSNNKTKEKLTKILLTPIEVTTSTNEIFLHSEKIYSSQKYSRRPDQDISDISVYFYEIIYQEKIKQILKSKTPYEFCDLNFAADTINTDVYTDGVRKKNRLSKEWIHCLANFWLIPFTDGRKREKPHKDYLDEYLIYVENQIRNENSQFGDYYDITEFRKLHFVPDNIDSKSINGQIEFIKRRASMIADSEYFEQLSYVFSNLQILQ